LLHARLAAVIATYMDRFRRLNIQLDIAESLADGLFKMQAQRYEKIFIGFGVPASERLSIIQAAGNLRQSIVELQDRNTIYRELHLKSVSGEWNAAR
jgi:hypothetical protein